VLANTLQEVVNAGKLRTIANAGLRIEINKRKLKDGSYTIHGSFRERGSGRRYVGYISTKTISNFKDRVEKYTPENITKRQIKNVAGIVK
jgi:hypothetical protein